MTFANVLFILVLVSGLATLVVLLVGILSMGRDRVEETTGSSRSNRLMAWRVRLQLIPVLLMPLWYLASRD
ncbi:MAG: HIG1 domain-containing protein [Reyranella sp.]|nr:HIG1 domain-containing protein [Reyranella sp.]